MSLPNPRSALPSLRFPAATAGQASQQFALQFQLERTQWWRPEQLEAAQFRQLRGLLAHAATTAPYYRDLFAARGFVLPTELDAAAWANVPVSRRRDLQAAGEGFFSTRPPAEHGNGVMATTSGSTGQPLKFIRNEVTMNFWRASVLRDLLWQGQDPSENVAAIRFAPVGAAEPPDGIVSPHWGNIIALLFPTGGAAMLNVACSFETQLDWLDRRAADRLISFPSNLLALAEHADRQGRKLPKVRHIRTVGEMLPAESRQRIAEAWGALVTDMYSCEETGYLALECPEHAAYHVQAESVRLEILDEADQPCPTGTPGRVVITSLNNFASPIIRMDLGDYAEMGPPCPCGRGLPVIRRILGRSRGLVVLPNGEKRYARIGEKAIIESAPGAVIYRFKCIQHDLERVEMQIVASRPLDAAEQANLAVSIQTNLGHPFEVFFTFPTDIPAGPNGKRENFVSLIDAP